MRETIISGNHVGLISSLPQWAQREIHRQDRYAAELERRLREVNWSPETNQIAIPAKTRISLKGRERPDNLWAHFDKSGHLEVATTGLIIIPQASNRVLLGDQHTLEDWLR